MFSEDFEIRTENLESFIPEEIEVQRQETGRREVEIELNRNRDPMENYQNILLDEENENQENERQKEEDQEDYEEDQREIIAASTPWGVERLD